MFGEIITKEKAIEQYNEFKAKYPTGFPDAVCYRLDEFICFVAAAIQMFDEKKVPMEERGIALTFGVHKGNRPYAVDKVTIMMIATQYVENDPKQGKVDKINNPIIVGWQGGTPPALDDVCYDAASLWP